MTKPQNKHREDEQDHTENDCECESFGEADTQEASSRKDVEHNSAKKLSLSTASQRCESAHKLMVGAGVPANPAS
jgi:hypothetical protein